MDLSVVLGIKGTVLRVKLVGSHGEDEAVFLALKAGDVVSAGGIDHAFREGAGMDQLRQGCGEVSVLLVELTWGADHDPQVSEGCRFRVGAGWITGELGLVSGRRILGSGEHGRGESEH